jgi:Na+-transporting methylmalonyl-CoA/oxaloacetate decarboxylase gamma subunit
MVDWEQAFTVGVVGFALVFFVLTILAVCMWMIGWIFNKTGDVKFPIRAKKLIKTDDNKNKPESVPEDKFELTIDDSDRYE